jgi:hypothetical protein
MARTTRPEEIDAAGPDDLADHSDDDIDIDIDIDERIDD